MVSLNDFSSIAALDLAPIKAKLMDEDGKGWTLEQASAVEVEYRRFLYLMKMFPNDATAPLVDVDTFWHYHILHTVKYAADCEQVFGYFLHHFPYLRMGGSEEQEVHARMGERMREVYEETFGDSYERPVADPGHGLWNAYCSVTAAKPAYCSVTAAKPAYCSVTAAKPAYCSVTAAKPAYCSVTAPKSAYCSVTDAKPAYCSVTAAKPAYCSITAAKSAYCSRIDAKSAYCSRIEAGEEAMPLTGAWQVQGPSPRLRSARPAFPAA